MVLNNNISNGSSNQRVLNDCKCRMNSICNCPENNVQVSNEHMLLQENMSRPVYREHILLQEDIMVLNNNMSNGSSNQRILNVVNITHPNTPNLIIATMSALIDT